MAALLGVALFTNAQSFQEGFFLRNYNLAYQYNPAFVGNNNFIGVGQVTYSTQRNTGAKSFYFPTENGLVSGLHSSIPASVFPGELPENIRNHGDLNATFFSFGFHKAGAFHTIEVNARGFYGISTPRTVYEFLKLGTGSGSCGPGEFRVDGNLFAELAYGYGRKLNDWLSIGGRAKLLLPLYGLRFDVSNLNVTSSEDRLSLDYKGDLYATNRSGKMEPNDEGYVNPFQLSDKGKLGALPSGAGLGIDLGIVATPAEGLTLSLSLLDVGGMYWYYGNRAESTGPLQFDGLDNLSYEQLNLGGLATQLLDVGKEFLQVMKPVSRNDKWHWVGLSMQANLGVKYEMPFYRRLAFGATGRYIARSGLPYWEGRLGLEINPLNWLDLVADAGMGTYGPVWGVAASVKLYRFHLTAGLQNGFGGTVPYSGQALEPNYKSVSLGLSFDL